MGSISLITEGRFDAPYVALLEQLYVSLNQHEYEKMADCYHPEATFHDIAFDLRGRDQIRGMWRMICSGDIRTTFEVVEANEAGGLVNVIDHYTFTDTGRIVRNPIQSRFRFRSGLIFEHRDCCDAKAWADAALGGVSGFLAGRFHFLRAWKARDKLRRFVAAES